MHFLALRITKWQWLDLDPEYFDSEEFDTKYAHKVSDDFCKESSFASFLKDVSDFRQNSSTLSVSMIVRPGVS